jgi:hypothetical protein
VAGKREREQGAGSRAQGSGMGIKKTDVKLAIFKKEGYICMTYHSLCTIIAFYD